jgi:hypothetical protein
MGCLLQGLVSIRIASWEVNKALVFSQAYAIVLVALIVLKVVTVCGRFCDA